MRLKWLAPIANITRFQRARLAFIAIIRSRFAERLQGVSSASCPITSAFADPATCAVVYPSLASLRGAEAVFP
jgi:hypothetical protein